MHINYIFTWTSLLQNSKLCSERERRRERQETIKFLFSVCLPHDFGLCNMSCIYLRSKGELQQNSLFEVMSERLINPSR